MTTLALFLVLAVLVALASAYLPARDKYPQVISHRGASGYVPEHSIAAYRLAMDLKTDYIEPDLCLSKDGVFVAMHDLLLDDTTNVASFPEFADRKTTKIVDGVSMTGYFISDFTLSELKTLRLNQRLQGRSTYFNGLLQIPTFTEIMDLVHTNFNSTGNMIGMYPELKHPSYFNGLGFPMVDMFLKQLEEGGFAIKGEYAYHDLSKVVPVVVQCFDASTLQEMRPKTDLPLILLVDKPVSAVWTESSLKTIATYANGIGPEKSFFGSGPVATARDNIKMAHDLKLSLHPWTFRADSGILSKFQGNFEAEEMYFYCCLGMDGLFSEFPDRSRETIDTYMNLNLGNVPVDQRTSCGVVQCQ